MQNEEPHPDQTLPGDLPAEPPPTEPPPTEPGAPETPPVEHDAVSAGGKCSACGWEYDNDGDVPHEVNISPESVHTPVEGIVAPPEPPPPPEPDPAACAAIPLQATCPKCGWSATDPEKGANPHPTL